MTITLPLQPEQEERLRALAEARGLTPETIVTEAIDRVLAEEPQATPAQPSEGPAQPFEGMDDARPAWQVIVENMKDVPLEVMAAMPADGASQHDHYIYGWPKREV